MVGGPNAYTFFSHWFRLGLIQHCQNKSERSQCCNCWAFQCRKPPSCFPICPQPHSRFLLVLCTVWSSVPASLLLQPKGHVQSTSLPPFCRPPKRFWYSFVLTHNHLASSKPVPTAPFWVIPPPSSSSPLAGTLLVHCSWPLLQQSLVFLLCSRSCLRGFQRVDGWCPGCTGLG